MSFLSPEEEFKKEKSILGAYTRGRDKPAFSPRDIGMMLAYGLFPEGIPILNMTRAEMIDTLLKNVKGKAVNLQGYDLQDNFVKKLMHRLSNAPHGVVDEIKSAPEVFGPVKKLTSEVHSQGNYWNDYQQQMNLDPIFMHKRALRHENVHARIGSPDYRREYIASQSYTDMAISDPKIMEKMVKKFSKNTRYIPAQEHFFHPEEIAAEAMEKIPLGGFKTLTDYVKRINSVFKDATEEAGLRRKTVTRYYQQAIQDAIKDVKKGRKMTFTGPDVIDVGVPEGLK